MFLSSNVQFRVSWICLVAVGALSGCGMPTWEELTKGKPATPPAPTNTPQPVTVTPPTVSETTKTPAKPSAEDVIANFKTLAPSQIDNSSIAALCALDDGVELVTDINASMSKVTDEGLGSLHKLTNLRTLELVGTTVSDKGCASIGQVPSLESLTLTGGLISAAGISHLVNLPQLKVLKINQTRLTQQGWELVGDLPALEELWIQQSSVDDAAMDALCNASTLRSLWINDTAVTDKGLQSLKKLEVLTHLNLGGCPVTCEGLGAVIKGNGLKSLINITVQRTPLNDKGAAAIGQVKTLKELNIGDLQGMTDKHLGIMVKAKKELRYLNISGNRGLTNDSLKALADLKELEELYMADVPAINNQGLQFLKKLKKLKTINYSGTGISEAGITELKKDLPELNRPQGVRSAQ